MNGFAMTLSCAYPCTNITISNKDRLMHTCIINTTLLTLYHCRIIYFTLVTKLSFIHVTYFVDFAVEMYQFYSLRMAL